MATRILLILVFLWPGMGYTQSTAPTPCPCCTAAHRQFDFWLGEWEAFQPNGKKAGDNHLILMQDSCVLQESWTSAGGNVTGTSYNYYDASTQKWYQVWIDNQGGSLRLSGGMQDGNMVLQSEEVPGPQGKPILNRITWTPNDDGSVRQLWEVSADQGATWKTSFDGTYRVKE